jgi:hypothetical protein
MARISEGTLKGWRDNERVDATTYVREQEVFRTAINDTQDQVDALASTGANALGRERQILSLLPKAL